MFSKLLSNTNPFAKGVVTSEFLTLVVGQVIGFLVLSGHVAPTDSDSLVKAVTDIIGAVILIFTSCTYIVSRIDLKKTIVTQGDLGSGKSDVPAVAVNVNPPVAETPAG